MVEATAIEAPQVKTTPVEARRTRKKDIPLRDSDIIVYPGLNPGALAQHREHQKERHDTRFDHINVDDSDEEAGETEEPEESDASESDDESDEGIEATEIEGVVTLDNLHDEVGQGFMKVFAVRAAHDPDSERSEVVGIYATLDEANDEVEKYLQSLRKMGGDYLKIKYVKNGGTYGSIVKDVNKEWEHVWVAAEVYPIDDVEVEVTYENEGQPEDDDPECEKCMVLQYHVLKSTWTWADATRTGQPVKTTKIEFPCYDRHSANQKCHDIFMTMTLPNKSIVGAHDKWRHVLCPTIGELLEHSQGVNEDGEGYLMTLDDDDLNGELCCTKTIRNQAWVEKAWVEKHKNFGPEAYGLEVEEYEVGEYEVEEQQEEEEAVEEDALEEEAVVEDAVEEEPVEQEAGEQDICEQDIDMLQVVEEGEIEEEEVIE